MAAAIAIFCREIGPLKKSNGPIRIFLTKNVQVRCLNTTTCALRRAVCTDIKSSYFNFGSFVLHNLISFHKSTVDLIANVAVEYAIPIIIPKSTTYSLGVQDFFTFSSVL